MSNLKEISGELLAIANLPPENRNKSLLDLSLIVQGSPDYEIQPAQKDLIASIIEDLIAENDAEQIAKSKLVFVEEVEEQIAPTKKTRAKKVVAPVVESTSDNLPDFIDSFSPIIELPKQVQKLVIFRNEQEGRIISDPNKTISNAFDWEKTPEGGAFWETINAEGDLREFKEKYGNKGEKVDAIISDDLPDFINKVTPISQLPEPIIKLFDLRRKKLGLKGAIDVAGYLSQLNWYLAPEGYDFWDKISNDGDLRQFKEKYGNKGEKIDEVIEFEELNQFVQTLTPPVAIADLPDKIKAKSKIKDLPEPVKELALFRQKEQSKPYNENVTTNNFIWRGTPEGTSFWGKVDKGDLKEFKRILGDKGERVEGLVQGLVGFSELFQLAEQKNAPAVKVSTSRATIVTPTPSATTQEVKRVDIILYPPEGGVLEIKTDSLYELFEVSRFILTKYKTSSTKLNISVITDSGSYTTEFYFRYGDSQDDLLDLLVEKYDTFVKPILNWENFDERQADIDKIKLSEEIINDAYPKPKQKPVKVVAPKPVVVEKPKAVKVVVPKVATPKPVVVEKPKPSKVVAPKVVKQKVTKPKVEDDLSFLDDLNNIF